MNTHTPMEANKLAVLNITEYNLIANKDPLGSYDRKTRENLYWVIEKLRENAPRLSPLEERLLRKFHNAQFGHLGEKEKRVMMEIVRYRLSNRVKQSLKAASLSIAVLLASGFLAYSFLLDARSRREVEVAFYGALNRVGLVSREDFDQIRETLTLAASELEKTKQEFQQLNQIIEEMTVNNKVTENLKYILKQIYNDPRAQYVKAGEDLIQLSFNNKVIASYKQSPELWYLLGVVESGVMRVFYNNEEILEIRSIFGRKGEETPLGEYRIKNKLYQPTWYKRETVDGKTRVRAIPFGNPEHDIGYWWMGLERLGGPVPGSYGIHGVNVTKVNEFYKKNFDWRSGSAGCPNIQDWSLNFLAKVVPVGVPVNIVAKDKWKGAAPPRATPSAA